MGCDIHIVLERRKRDSGEWIGQWCSDNLPDRWGRPKCARRDYGLFSRFGVRGPRDDGNAIYPRNIPEDVSRLAWSLYMLSPTDHHSASYCSLEEFIEAWRAENPNDAEVRKDWAHYDLFGVDLDWPENAEYRLVFWFDN